MTTKVSGVMLEDGAVAEADTGFTAGNYPRVALDGTLEERTPTQVRSDIGAGTGNGSVTSVAVADATGITWTGSPITTSGTLTPALDSTLVALAGANWAANSLAIGSGADTVAQVTFAANTFPARTSTGNLVAKSITDSAAGMLTQVVEGTYTPVLVNVANIASSTMRLATWHRVGNTVTVMLEWECSCTAAAATVTRGRITLPIASALANSFELSGCGTSLDTTFAPIAIFGDVANDQAELRFLANSTANRVNTCMFSYRVI